MNDGKLQQMGVRHNEERDERLERRERRRLDRRTDHRELRHGWVSDWREFSDDSQSN